METRAMAIAYGLPYVVCTEREGAAIAGTTSAAAADAGVAGITPEVGGCGLVEEDAIAAHVRGVENVLRSLGMLATSPGLVRVMDPERLAAIVRAFVI